MKTGQPIYRLGGPVDRVADAGSCFPKTRRRSATASGRARVQSLPGEVHRPRRVRRPDGRSRRRGPFGVRVVMPNETGRLRVGDYATATIEVLVRPRRPATSVYDPELAGKWISPRHPHVVRAAAGQVPGLRHRSCSGSTFGFADEPVARTEATCRSAQRRVDGRRQQRRLRGNRTGPIRVAASSNSAPALATRSSVLEACRSRKGSNHGRHCNGQLPD